MNKFLGLCMFVTGFHAEEFNTEMQGLTRMQHVKAFAYKYKWHIAFGVTVLAGLSAFILRSSSPSELETQDEVKIYIELHKILQDVNAKNIPLKQIDMNTRSWLKDASGVVNLDHVCQSVMSIYNRNLIYAGNDNTDQTHDNTDQTQISNTDIQVICDCLSKIDMLFDKKKKSKIYMLFDKKQKDTDIYRGLWFANHRPKNYIVLSFDTIYTDLLVRTASSHLDQIAYFYDPQISIMDNYQEYISTVSESDKNQYRWLNILWRNNQVKFEHYSSR